MWYIKILNKKYFKNNYYNNILKYHCRSSEQMHLQIS